ncbi:MAG: hypothetical protein ACI97A_000842 [Planctomycetota bacterium]|jgi:hypothetical protein
MSEHSITPDFWDKLSQVRTISRLTLNALEANDIDEVERLSKESDAVMTEIKPIIEARAESADRNEDDFLLKELLIELQTMNDRILEEVIHHRDETLKELNQIRSSKLKLVHYKSTAQPDPALINTQS